jgi:hypothetical protein
MPGEDGNCNPGRFADDSARRTGENLIQVADFHKAYRQTVAVESLRGHKGVTLIYVRTQHAGGPVYHVLNRAAGRMILCRRRRKTSYVPRFICCYSIVSLNLHQVLAATPMAKAQWSDLTPIERRDFISWMDSAKQPEAHKRRIEQACVMLAAGKRRPRSLRIP